MSIKRKYIYILSVVIAIGVVAFFVFKRGSLRDYSDMQRKGILQVSTDYSSMDYFVDGDTISGFQYELVNALCDSLHLKPEWSVENSLDKNIQDLKDGDIDLIARSIPVTTTLREQMAFSLPILHIKQVLVQRKAQYNLGKLPLRNQLDLAKKTVYIPAKSPNILRLKNLESEIADTIYVKQMPQYEAEQLMIMVAKGDIEFAVCDAQTARINAALLPEIDIETAISFTQMQSWAMRPSSTQLQAKVDSFLTRFLKTKAYQNIYRKYYR